MQDDFDEDWLDADEDAAYAARQRRLAAAYSRDYQRWIETLSPVQASQLASAVATLSGRGGNGLLERVRQSTGLDDIDVTTSEEGETELAVGKYLSDNIYTDVTVGSEGTAATELNLGLCRSVTVTGRTSNSGESGSCAFLERDH